MPEESKVQSGLDNCFGGSEVNCQVGIWLLSFLRQQKNRASHGPDLVSPMGIKIFLRPCSNDLWKSTNLRRGEAGDALRFPKA